MADSNSNGCSNGHANNNNATTTTTINTNTNNNNSNNNSNKVANWEILETVLRNMPIWTPLETLLNECKDLKQQMIDFSNNCRETRLKIDSLPMFNTFKRVDINDKIEINHKRAIIPLPAQASFLQDKKTRQLIRVALTDDICATPEKIHAQQLEESRKQKCHSILLLEQKLEIGEPVYVCVSSKPQKPWMYAKVTLIYPRNGHLNIRVQTTEDPHRTFNVNKYRIARMQLHENHLRPTKRVIAGVTPSTMVSGIIAEFPHKYNNNRYLVFLDNATARYHQPKEVFPILGQSRLPWKDMITEDENKTFANHLRSFFAKWPHRQLAAMQVGEKVDVYYKDTIVDAQILDIDCSIIRLLYPDNREETVYRGSPRFAFGNRIKDELLKDEVDTSRFDTRIKEFITLYSEAGSIALDEKPEMIVSRFIEDKDNRGFGICRRNVAKKATTQGANGKKSRSSPEIHVSLTGATIEDCENLDDNYPYDDQDSHKKCTPECLDEPPDLENVQKFRDASVLTIPSLLGWKRNLIKNDKAKKSSKIKFQIIYKSPCGRNFRFPSQVCKYIKDTGSQLDIDYFTFDSEVRFHASLPFDTTAIAKYYEPDLSMVEINGRYKALEKKPVSIINTVNHERLPLDFEYRAERFFHPNLRKKGFTFNEEFRSCCDCEDNCATRAACACQNLTEDFNSKGPKRGQFIDRIQYRNKRIFENVKTGIFECNPDCKCNSKCPNRVVQNGLRFRLQVFKTIDKGWGVRTLDIIPKGAFVSTYSAEVLDDADQYGDSDVYYADLDYITVLEAEKEGYESDVEDPDCSEESFDDGKQNDKEKVIQSRENNIDPSDSEISDNMNDNDLDNDNDNDPDTFKPAPEDLSSSSESENEFFDAEEGAPVDYDYAPKPNNYKKRKRIASKPKSRYPKRHRVVVTKSPRTKKEPVKFRRIKTILGTRNNYTLDARMQGNVGRFYNHCCEPNTFVQNVFIDTHDLRFPIVAFFAQKKIDAMEEITWNYQYKLDSIPGRELKCYCGTYSCKGRIL